MGGLATITPAAGYVSPLAAVVIGCAAGAVCYYAVALKNRLRLDDALDVWGVHGVGGVLGILALGVLGSTQFNPAGTNGLLAGNANFFLVELGAVVLAVIWALGFTFGMLWVIDRITTIRVTAETEAGGLDEGLHGEAAYEGI